MGLEAVIEDVVPEPARARRRAAISMRIERATLELAAEQGLENLTVEQIAAAVGISRRTFYRYFDTIDDILCEMPRRSLRRMARVIAARPACETVMEAFVNMADDLRKAKEADKDVEEIQRLGFKVAKRSPEAWWRAMSLVQATTNEAYQQMITDRLRTSGGNPAHGPLLGAVMLAILGQVLRDNSDTKAEKGVDPGAMSKAIETVAEAFGVAKAQT